VIIDPRAGHGPGIGGFKDDSQVGVALHAGHPVYFVIFFRDPEPGQTLLDVCNAEQQFVKRVRELHPASAKPVIVGNCQGGWAAMMLAAADPDDTGPIVINGAPMSYWGGAFQEGAGDNPMRYAGGMLGGTWLSSFAADMGDGIFDGAYLVENFENLNPANTFWDKYYNLFANVDTEPPRFLEFERWWGGFYLMNREEIEWITRNLFVGNKLWSGTKGTGGKTFDLRDIKAPIVLFASMGDNITPPQQAFNWVADVYGSTEEIKARGQVIVGLLHQDIGHLGIFVSGKVAKKEHAQIVEVLKSIESLPPGLYGMRIHETKARDGKVVYDVDFLEQRLEDVTARLNRLERADEKPFEAVAAISEFNQRAYELFAQPFVQSLGNEVTAKVSRQFHPLRFQRWALSDFNPWLAWVGPAAQAVKAQRQAAGPDNPAIKIQKLMSEGISASLDYYRETRDATSEAAFFQTYGNVFSLYLADKHATKKHTAEIAAEPRDLPFVKEALASIAEGGYAEALARVGSLLALRGAPLPLARLALKHALTEEYRELLPDFVPDQWRRIRGEQDIIVRYEPEKAVATLPKLLAKPGDRERLVTLVRRLLADERMRRFEPTTEQLAMIANIGETLDVAPARVRPKARPRSAARKPTAKTRKRA
jgi:pimeloyl-ACP methyl ester carboxylesterase